MTDEEKRDKEWIDAGFTIEYVGTSKVYSRPVSEVTKELSRLFTRTEKGEPRERARG